MTNLIEREQIIRIIKELDKKAEKNDKECRAYYDAADSLAELLSEGIQIGSMVEVYRMGRLDSHDQKKYIGKKLRIKGFTTPIWYCNIYLEYPEDANVTHMEKYSIEKIAFNKYQLMPE